MGKTKIEFEYMGKSYTLEYTAESLKKMERGGFDFTNIDKRVLTLGEDLFYGAFLANHADTPQETAKAIYDAMAADSGEETLIGVLDEMLGEAIESITNKRGNLRWKVVR